jgi:hypothetical protein
MGEQQVWRRPLHSLWEHPTLHDTSVDVKSTREELVQQANLQLRRDWFKDPGASTSKPQDGWKSGIIYQCPQSIFGIWSKMAWNTENSALLLFCLPQVSLLDFAYWTLSFCRQSIMSLTLVM